MPGIRPVATIDRQVTKRPAHNEGAAGRKGPTDSGKGLGDNRRRFLDGRRERLIRKRGRERHQHAQKGVS